MTIVEVVVRVFVALLQELALAGADAAAQEDALMSAQEKLSRARMTAKFGDPTP
jgi:hypothetical protein